MKARKKDTPAGGRKNYFLETLLFLAVMVLTLRFCFSGQKPQEIWAAVKSMRGMSLAGAVALGLFFVCMEGTIIRILLGAAGGKSGLLTCISYSFLGFFYSGITPSATGGQPMQLYEMKKDGNSVSSSTVVLMVTAWNIIKNCSYYSYVYGQSWRSYFNICCFFWKWKQLFKIS